MTVRSSRSRVPLFLAAALMTVAACQRSEDPRLGEEGRVRFSGGGCTSSTTLAVGARAQLELESATDDPLPGELGVRSDEPAVMSARMGLEPNQIELEAHAEGESRIEVLSQGDEIDALVFSAAPAGRVSFGAEARVFGGGAIDVAVSDVFGDCGSDDCRLLGNGFLGWRVEPPSAGGFVLDFDGMASFRAGEPGNLRLVGREPLRGADLVDHPVEVVATTGVTELEAAIETLHFDPETQGTQLALPGAVARPDALVVRVSGKLADGTAVALSRRDVAWRVEGNEILVAAPFQGSRDGTGTLFLAADNGTVSLVADVKLLNLEQSFELQLTPP
jgi:hypothetical protein